MLLSLSNPSVKFRTLPSSEFAPHTQNSPRIHLVGFRPVVGPPAVRLSAATVTEAETSRPVDAAGLSSEAPESPPETRLSVGVGSPGVPAPVGLRAIRLSLGDQAFFLLTFIACTTSIAFTSLVIAAVPTLHAMRKAAISLSRLADTAREELPSTMAAIRLSGMEISDLTLELSDLSQEIADSVTKSAQAVQAAEAGIRQIGSLAREKTMSMIQERANLPNISLQPVVVGAAKKTSRVVGQARKTIMNIISGGDSGSYYEDDSLSDRVEV
ncbi:hypothetical protein QJS04_geneDACA012662 [Acorus gramineus]|uniref:Uncharacterized protein n=1 Tax=Acorus gramineus TaxID=55184 RepID=A0AAV9B7L2_ACOGR|nr:hypothetical protein QJS04_geneDACA012662 [Acorus gramineus]